jgi:hypothetical protein
MFPQNPLALLLVLVSGIVTVTSKTFVLPNGDVLSTLNADIPLTFQAASKRCNRPREEFTGLLRIMDETTRDQMKEMFKTKMWTSALKTDEVGHKNYGKYSWDDQGYVLVNYTITPLDKTHPACNRDCCTLFFDPSTGKVYESECGSPEIKYTTVCHNYHQENKDEERKYIQEGFNLESTVRKGIQKNLAAVNTLIYHTKSDTSDRLDQIDDSLNSLTKKLASLDDQFQEEWSYLIHSQATTIDKVKSLQKNKKTLTAFIVISLLLNVLLAVGLAFLFKKMRQ